MRISKKAVNRIFSLNFNVIEVRKTRFTDSAIG